MSLSAHKIFTILREIASHRVHIYVWAGQVLLSRLLVVGREHVVDLWLVDNIEVHLYLVQLLLLP